mgnify:CR=1 FL=1
MFVCSECGYHSTKWLGRCPICNRWQSFYEAEDTEIEKDNLIREEAPQLFSNIEEKKTVKFPTNIKEFDSILGGGLVEGEVVLIGGEPGVGKSTLLLQIGASLSHTKKVLYVSAEESPQQINFRAQRLNKDFSKLYIVSEDNVLNIYKYFKEYNFEVILVDSIQVIHHPDVESVRGSINQVKSCAEFLMRLAKTKDVTVIIIGHITKEGSLAGPKLLEHIVDCVLYFEQEMLSSYRILRATKNRFGATGQIAVFEMTSLGLKEVKNISDVFLPHKDNPVAGSAICCALEGFRPLLIELQALVSKSNLTVVRRRAVGFDFNRFSLLIATIEKRLRLALHTQDIFLNVAGGVKISDPAVDLAALCAIISSFREKELEANSVFIGEVGLAGELRPISHLSLRLKEIERAGFKQCFVPKGNINEIDKGSYSFNIVGLSSAEEILEVIGG